MKNTEPLIGAKLKSKTHLQNTFFDYLSRFLRVRLQSLQKVLICMTQKNFFWQNLKRYQKRRISRWFRIRWKSCRKMHQKKVISKKSLTNMRTKWKKGLFSVTFLLITFLWCIFSKLFLRIRNQREILRFLIPKLNFFIKFFLLLLALFVNFDCKCAGNGSKKRKIFFYECFLEFY